MQLCLTGQNGRKPVQMQSGQKREKDMGRCDLKGRTRQWVLPWKEKKCRGFCLSCRWYRRCRQETGGKGEPMKRVMKPALAQKKYLRSRGLVPEQWYVLKDTPEFMEVVSRREPARCRMRKLEGADAEPRTRILRKADI